jgi:hypothetical protein
LLFAAAFLGATFFVAGPARAATPVDASKVQFQAFRSFGYDLVPGEDFFVD